MNAINVIDPNIAKTIRKTVTPDSGDSADSARTAAFSAGDRVSLSSLTGPRRIVSTYETVSISDLVPKPLSAKKMENAQTMAEKLRDGDILTVREEDNLREDRILAAIVGMRLIQQGEGVLEKRWIGGMNPPTEEELDAAYRRLTQRVSSPSEAENPESVRQFRLELLDTYREYKQEQKNKLSAAEEELASIAA